MKPNRARLARMIRYRTQEVAGSSPASSIDKGLASRPFLLSDSAADVEAMSAFCLLPVEAEAVKPS
jgi:hypothetical protein